MKKVLKYLLYLFLTLVIAFGIFLLYATISDYKPDEQTEVFKSDSPDLLADTLQLRIMSWNIGYCGLHAEADFFYDGGEMVRPEEERVKKNLQAVLDKLRSENEIDFFLLQEVDKNSKRSYGINQFDSISGLFPEYNASFGKNYDVFFVPQPLNKPMGRVESGLLSLSKFTPASSVRYSFPGNFSWPLGLFFLDRCFLLNRYTLENEKELVLINTHNSAYDDGELRDQQMNFLKTVLQQEYENGNYVIVGGDWNQCPPAFKADFKNNKMDNENRKDISPGYFPDWTWAFDSKAPTNRRVFAPYDAATSPTTVIDFFLLSPNIELQKVKTRHLNFEFSDHNPVFLNIKLK